MDTYGFMPRGGEILGWVTDEALIRFKALLWPADFLHVYVLKLQKTANYVML